MAATCTITLEQALETHTGGMHTRRWLGFQSTMLSMRPLSMCPVHPTTPRHRPSIGMTSRPRADPLALSSMASNARTPCLLGATAASMGLAQEEKGSCPP